MQTVGILTSSVLGAAALAGGATKVAGGTELSMIGAVATQVPALAVLCVVVYIFVKHLNEATTSWQKTVRDLHEESATARREAIEQIHMLGNHCHEVQKHSIEAAREVAIATQEVTGAVNTLKAAVEAAELARGLRQNGGG